MKFYSNKYLQKKNTIIVKIAWNLINLRLFYVDRLCKPNEQKSCFIIYFFYSNKLWRAFNYNS